MIDLACGRAYIEEIRSTIDPKTGTIIKVRKQIPPNPTIDVGLLDENMQIYGLLLGAVYKASPKPHWTFGGKAKVSFMHIDGDRDLPKWQGSQFADLLSGFR